ncbi:hypothetical protein Syun_020592 [Stephania yunnanensis]|uniref:Uncharacterized protein n=1 Tax=Stephania yunnanensis TaxID=152371 RepID=A0AAP0IEH3_9MAGN
MAMQAVGMSFSKIELLSGAAYTLPRSWRRMANWRIFRRDFVIWRGRFKANYQVGVTSDVQCTTAMQTSTRGLSSKDNKGTSSSLEADSCIMVAEHELEMQESKGSTS